MKYYHFIEWSRELIKMLGKNTISIFNSSVRLAFYWIVTLIIQQFLAYTIIITKFAGANIIAQTFIDISRPHNITIARCFNNLKWRASDNTHTDRCNSDCIWQSNFKWIIIAHSCSLFKKIRIPLKCFKRKLL